MSVTKLTFFKPWALASSRSFRTAASASAASFASASSSSLGHPPLSSRAANCDIIACAFVQNPIAFSRRANARVNWPVSGDLHSYPEYTGNSALAMEAQRHFASSAAPEFKFFGSRGLQKTMATPSPGLGES